MRLAPLTLERYFAERFEFTVNPKCDLRQPLELRIDDLQVKSRIDYLPEAQIEAQSQNAARKAKISLGVCYQPAHEGNFPYSFRLDLVGFFAVATGLREVDPDRLLELNGSSILFGVAREMIASFTARGPFPLILLPSISFPTEESAPSPTETSAAKAN
jgi:hypothetical protein